MLYEACESGLEGHWLNVLCVRRFANFAISNLFITKYAGVKTQKKQSPPNISRGFLVLRFSDAK